MELGIQTRCNVAVTLNRQRINKKGEARLYIRISVEREKKLIPMPFSWPVDCFDQVQGEILPREVGDRDYQEFLTILNLEKAKYWRVVKKFLLKDERFTIKDILFAVKIGEKSKLLGHWMFYKTKETVGAKEIKEDTARNHRSSARELLNYCNDDIEIILINTKWLNHYMAWLLKRMEYSSAWARIKDIKTYLHIAEMHGIPINEDLKNHHLPSPIHDPVYCTKEELDLLFDYYYSNTISDSNKSALRCFLFACFTGLRISDLKRFNANFIEGEEIVFPPTKRRLSDLREHVIRIPLLGVAKSFLENISDEPLVAISEQKYNVRLKQIAGLAGVNKKLTSHVARHTFATQLAMHGVPVVVISELLGHRSTKSTMVYIHVAEQVKKKEMTKLQETFGRTPLRISS